MSQGPDKFIAAISGRLVGDVEHPEITALLYVDEAHELCEVTNRGSSTLYDTFTEVFDFLSQSRPIFLITISTDPVIRQSSQSRLQAPYTELVFDCLLDERPIFAPGKMTLQDVSTASFMTKFGRPM